MQSSKTISRARSLAAGTFLLTSMAMQAGYAASGDYCSTPLLYATNIRPACEQFGVDGLDALARSSQSINAMQEKKVRVMQTRATATKLGSLR